MFSFLNRSRTVEICALLPLSDKSPAMMQKSIGCLIARIEEITFSKKGTHLSSKKCRSLTMMKPKFSPVESSARKAPGQSEEASSAEPPTLSNCRRDTFFRDCIPPIVQHY